MNSCSTCGCAPCTCANPGILNQPRIIDPIISGGSWVGATLNGPTVNGGTLNGPNLIGATIDCTTLGCTQPPGTNDATLATTAFVNQAINDAFTDPSFCTFVSACLAGAPALCTEVINCINTTPGSIFNPIAFDPAAFATTLQAGVIRIATLGEVQGASCGIALDPCTLQAFFAAGGPNALWNSFAAAVDSLITTSATLCAAVFTCGAAPLASPVFSGDPQVPTPPPGDNDTSIANTAFVNTAIVNALAGAISGGNPTFCAAVSSCLAGGAAGNFASFTVPVSHPGGPGNGVVSGPAVQNYGCVATGGPGPINVTFTTPQPDLNYICGFSMRATSGAAPQIFTGPNSAFPTLAAHNIGLEAASIVSTVTVNGVTDIVILSPEVAGGVPYNGFVTVVFSR